MKVSKKAFILILYFIVINLGCEFKRDAIGSDNEIRVICSKLDRGNVKHFLKMVFNDTLYTPEPEPFYNLKFSTPETYPKLKKQNNVIIAAIDRDHSNPGLKLIYNLLPKEQAKSMEENDPIILAKDVHAKHQLFMVINANSFKQLIDFVDKKRNFIRKKFNNQFINRQSRFLFNRNNYNRLKDTLIHKYGWSLDLPWGWSFVKEVPDSNFIWLGKEMPYQWIGVGWAEGNLVKNELLAGNYIWEWPKMNYKTVQFSDYKFKLNKTNYNNSLAWRATGVWETLEIKDSKGGPFRSYIFYDNEKDLTYHINYLIFYPGNSKSIFFRQADMILKTFKTNLK